MVFALMKFFPRAFLVTPAEAPGPRFQLPDLDPFRDAPIDSEHDVLFSLRCIKSLNHTLEPWIPLHLGSLPAPARSTHRRAPTKICVIR